MPNNRSTARGQHHVPIMLQDAFATSGNGKKRQVHVLDKHDGRTFRTSPENILQERDFNTFQDGETTYCLEEGMGKIEHAAAPAIRKLIANRTLGCLKESERAAILVFTALQRIRGVHTRAGMLDVAQKIRGRLRENGDNPDAVPQLRGSDDPEAIKLSALMLIGEGMPDFLRSYSNKVMVLMEAIPGETFLLGDTPVVLANQRDTFPHGNLGLEVKGIEIYMPISPELTIAFWCPSIVEMIENALRMCEDSIRKTSAVALLGIGPDADKVRELQPQLKAKAEMLQRDLSAIGDGRPLVNARENMEYVNSLQVSFAERYVLSSTGDFALPRRMIAENSGYRQGHRWQLA